MNIPTTGSTFLLPTPKSFLSASFRGFLLFPLLCGVDVSYETPPCNPVLCVPSAQFSLRQVVPDAIQPPPLWSSSSSIPRYLHRHHSLAYVFVFSSQYMPIHLNPLSCTFLDISPTLRRAIHCTHDPGSPFRPLLCLYEI